MITCVLTILAHGTGTTLAPSQGPLDEAVREEIAAEHTGARSRGAALSRDAIALAGGNAAKLLEALHVQFRTFERDDGSDPALGFDYAIDKALMRSTDSSHWALEFVAHGNVAFDQGVNPDDFLSTTLRVRWFGTHAFGERKEVASTDLLAFDPQRFASAAARFATFTSADEIRKDPEFVDITRRYYHGYQDTLPSELVYDADLHASLESNQDFSSRQEVFGASFGGRFVSWNPDASASRLNVFDFPGAAVRWLAGDEDFAPSGQAYPTVVVGLDLVEASDDDARSALTSDDAFLRARIEAGMKTRVYSTEGADYYLSAGWRLYQEFDAPAAVKSAELDQFSHAQIQLDLPKGWAVTYAAGKLPLDGEEDSTFALGLNVQF